MFDDPTPQPGNSPVALDARLLTLPVVLIALLADVPFNVSLYRDKRVGRVWWFRFAHRATLRLDGDGGHQWRGAHERIRETVEPRIAKARAIVDGRDRVAAAILSPIP